MEVWDYDLSSETSGNPPPLIPASPHRVQRLASRVLEIFPAVAKQRVMTELEIHDYNVTSVVDKFMVDGGWSSWPSSNTGDMLSQNGPTRECVDISGLVQGESHSMIDESREEFNALNDLGLHELHSTDGLEGPSMHENMLNGSMEYQRSSGMNETTTSLHSTDALTVSPTKQMIFKRERDSPSPLPMMATYQTPATIVLADR